MAALRCHVSFIVAAVVRIQVAEKIIGEEVSAENCLSSVTNSWRISGVVVIHFSTTAPGRESMAHEACAYPERRHGEVHEWSRPASPRRDKLWPNEHVK